MYCFKIKIMAFKTDQKVQNTSFSRSKWTTTWISGCKHLFFKIWMFKQFLSSKYNAFFSQIESLRLCFFSIQNLKCSWTLIQNLTSCILLKSKFDALCFSISKVCFWNGAFSFPLNFYKCYSLQRKLCWKMTRTWGKKLFLWVCRMCLSHFGALFLLVAFFMAIGFLMGLMTISFALPIDLYEPFWHSRSG